MAEVYETPDHISPEPQEVSVDTLAQEELEGMQSRLSALADAGTVADHVGNPREGWVLRLRYITLARAPKVMPKVKHNQTNSKKRAPCSQRMLHDLRCTT